MFRNLNIGKYERPLSDRKSDEVIKELSWFKDYLMAKTELKFWIREVFDLLDSEFNKKDKQFKSIVVLQQDIIDYALLRCINNINIALASKTYISVKDSVIDLFVLKSIICKKSRKFNLQIIQLFNYQEFCHRNLIDRNKAIKTLQG